jgi:hypothetical protein
MFRKNEGHLQPLLISNVADLPVKRRKRLEQSWAGVFYREFFCRLREEAFAVLYADCPSRPNIPVNVLVGLEALKSGFGWSDEELYDHFLFDVQVRYALGYRDLHEGDFELRTLYNFRQRLSQYQQETGENLLEQALEEIADQQLVAFKVRTGLQRMDSTQIASNILDMSRLQLLVEGVQRLHRILSEAEQARLAEWFAPYVRSGSGQYVYRIKGPAATTEAIRQVGQVLYHLLCELEAAYGQHPAYQVVRRLFAEHFCIQEQEVQSKSNQELSAGSLQSLDDLEATFRRKGSKEYKGYVANVTETCDPENSLQLITKVQVASNNRDDADLLKEALPDLKKRTAVETLYTDGGFGSPAADEELAQQRVEQIQTALRGRSPDPERFSLADFGIERAEDGAPTALTCPAGQRTVVEAGRSTGFVARFAQQQCKACPFQQRGRCRARPRKRDPRFVLSFTQQEINLARRRQRYRDNRQAEKNLRVAVEATVRSLKHPFGSQLPVRGLFRVSCMLLGSAAMVNVRRIWRHLHPKVPKADPLGQPPKEADPSSNPSSFALSFPRAWLPRCPRLPVFRNPCFSC